MRSSLPDAPENLREFRFSAAFSFRLLSLLLAFRSSLSKSRVHQPARASHLWASTLSITWSMSTPAWRIRSRQSFSISVVNGAGWRSFRITCCWGACSVKNGCCRMSGKVGLSSGRFDKSSLISEIASAGRCSGYFGSSVNIFVLVTLSSSSSKGSSPQRSAYRMTPKLQTSTFSPAYFSPFNISGAE